MQLVKRRETAVLTEPFGTPDELVARGPEGGFTHELVVPFVRTAAAKSGSRRPAAHRSPAVRTAEIPRVFPPGSEWLYAKLYTGTAAGDRLLLDFVGPLVEELRRTGAIDEWFFLRYRDPDFHLRVRMHGKPDALHARALPAIEAAAEQPLADGRLRRLQLDTYEREVERYGGGEGVLVSERIFTADSDAVLSILGRLEPDDEGADERWRLALLGAAALFSDFGLDGGHRAEPASWAWEVLGRERRGSSVLVRALGDRFRRERSRLEPLLDLTDDADHPLAPGIAIFRERSSRLAPLVAELRALEEAKRLAGPVSGLVPSYVHMHVNRIVRSETATHELVLHDFLTRLYRSRGARRAAGV